MSNVLMRAGWIKFISYYKTYQKQKCPEKCWIKYKYGLMMIVIRQRPTLIKLSVSPIAQMSSINLHFAHVPQDTAMSDTNTNCQCKDTGGTHNTQRGYYRLLLLTRVPDLNLYSAPYCTIVVKKKVIKDIFDRIR